MSERSIFAGPGIRRIRKRAGLTQAAMAQRLDISPSYLNLIERNQRALSARVMMRLVSEFEFDPRSLEADESIGGLNGLTRRFGDERFKDLTIDREEMLEFLQTSPQIAAAFARLYDHSDTRSANNDDPLTASRQLIERWNNHFPDLDRAAETLSDELRLSRGDIGTALVERLRERHQLAVRILPREVMPEHLRRLDLHARQVQLSEMLPLEARNMQFATQIAQLEFRAEVEALSSGASGDTARKLFERHLYRYGAAALIMPYGRFLRACQQTDYDFRILQRRFTVSFEQLAHRLTTLQRVGERGLPFFLLRIDRAGQVSKRFAGASNAAFLEAEHTCPLWNAHKAFERYGEYLVEYIELADPNPSEWVSIASAVTNSGLMGESRFAIVLGIERRLATTLAAVRALPLRSEDAARIGPGCRNCSRADCVQRSRTSPLVPLKVTNMEDTALPFPPDRASASILSS